MPHQNKQTTTDAGRTNGDNLSKKQWQTLLNECSCPTFGEFVDAVGDACMIDADPETTIGGAITDHTDAGALRTATKLGKRTEADLHVAVQLAPGDLGAPLRSSAYLHTVRFAKRRTI